MPGAPFTWTELGLELRDRLRRREHLDHEGDILEVLVQRRRDRGAAVKLMRKLMRKRGFAPKRVVNEKLRSYGAAFQHLRLSRHPEQGLRQNNRAEISHQGGRTPIAQAAVPYPSAQRAWFDDPSRASTRLANATPSAALIESIAFHTPSFPSFMQDPSAGSHATIGRPRCTRRTFCPPLSLRLVR
jgi:DDE domain